MARASNNNGDQQADENNGNLLLDSPTFSTGKNEIQKTLSNTAGVMIGLAEKFAVDKTSTTLGEARKMFGSDKTPPLPSPPLKMPSKMSSGPK